MKIGVFTPLLSALSLDQVLKKLKSLDIDTVEFGTGNYPGDAHAKLSMLDNPAELATFKSKIADAGMTISALSCHGNPLHPDKEIRDKHQDVCKRTILLAEKLGIARRTVTRKQGGGTPLSPETTEKLLSGQKEVLKCLRSIIQRC